MLSFEKIFANWFDDDNISFADLEAGTRDHLDRLRQGNEQGRFAALITATDARYLAYFGQRAQAATARSTGKGHTLTLDEAIQEMVDWLVGNGQEYIHYKLKSKSDRTRFYPRGNGEYHQAKHGEWPGLLERLDTAFDDLGADFEAGIKATYARLR